MTIASEVNRSGPYPGNGVTVAFDYKFLVVDRRHLQVIRTDAANVDTILTIDVDYTVTGVGNVAGGQAVLNVPLPAGQKVTNLLNVPFTQELDLENQGAYLAQSVEDALDIAAQRDLQLKERLDRAVVIPPSAPQSELDKVIANIGRLADSADNLDTVANIAPDVSTVAGIAAKVTTVSDIANKVSTVADNTPNVNTVAGDTAKISTLAAMTAAINIAANYSGQINTVSSISGAVQTVSTRAAQVVAVAGNEANIDTVADISANVSAVAGISAKVTTVADSVAKVANVSDKIDDVTNFADVYNGPHADDPTTRNDGSPLGRGDLYFNTVAREVRFYDGASWQSVAQQALNMTTNAFTGDGVKTTFTLGRAPGTAANVLVWVNNVRLIPLDDYSVDDEDLIIFQAPAQSATIDTLVVSTTAILASPSAGTVTAETISNDANEKKKILEKLGLDPWAVQPIGTMVTIAPFAGAPVPPTNKAYRYVKLTANDAYNSGITSSETLSGSAPSINATAVIQFAGSPFNGVTFRMLNTERRFLRPGSPGTLEESQNLSHAHTYYDPGHAHSYLDRVQGANLPWYNSTGASRAMADGVDAGRATNGATVNITIQASGGNEARPRDIGADYYVRIF